MIPIDTETLLALVEKFTDSQLFGDYVLPDEMTIGEIERAAVDLARKFKAPTKGGKP